MPSLAHHPSYEETHMVTVFRLSAAEYKVDRDGRKFYSKADAISHAKHLAGNSAQVWYWDSANCVIHPIH